MLMRTTNHDVESSNRFLRLLSDNDRALIDQDLERITLVPGFPLHTAGGPIDFIYFPEAQVVSMQNGGSGHAGVETAVIGCEGLIGWSGLIGCTLSSQTAMTQMRAGTFLRIPIGDMRTACAASATLQSAVLLFVEVVIGQMAQAIVSNLRDTIERRVCRWILMRHDRMVGDHLLVKHDDISANLGVRRASITDCLHVLEGDRLIRCNRGRIVVRDRSGLEMLAGEAYGAPEAYYRTLLGPFGRSHEIDERPNPLSFQYGAG